MELMQNGEPIIHVPDPDEMMDVLHAVGAGADAYFRMMDTTAAGRAYSKRNCTGRTGHDRRRRVEQHLRAMEKYEPIPFDLLQQVVKDIWDVDLPDNYGFEHVPPG